MKIEECDIIIIGAGTAGCVLANRLSEDTEISIVILEAGENCNNDEKVYTPGLAGKLLDNPEFDWQYVSEKQPGLNGRQIKHPRGKVVGGSSAINSFALIYPSATGMDVWEQMGNPGWGWTGTKDYFRKFHTLCDADEKVQTGLRLIEPSQKSSGPIQARLPLSVTPLQQAWSDAFQSVNAENTLDPLDGAAVGGYVSTNHITNDRQERSHAGVAYLQPVLDRKNVTLITGASVERVVFDRSVAAAGSDAIATGVVYIKDGVKHQLNARKEVILAAGAFASPQLLELSGIGDSALLKKHGIDVVQHNANIGENLQDHIRGAISFEVADGIEILKELPEADARALYETDRSGPWAESGCYMFAYMPLSPFLSQEQKQELSKLAEECLETSSSAADQRYNKYMGHIATDPSETTATAFLTRKPRDAPPDTRWLTLCAMLSYPFSRGSVHITSPDVSERSKIDFRYYSNPLDLEIHGRHMQSLTQLAKTAPLAKFIKPDGKRWPKYSGSLTIDRAKEQLREYTGTNYHPCGTCSMMPKEMGGVVDAKLRVYGTSNLRIVDASIMPVIPRGNIISTVYAVAEKAADIVSSDLGIRRTS